MLLIPQKVLQGAQNILLNVFFVHGLFDYRLDIVIPVFFNGLSISKVAYQAIMHFRCH